MEKKNCKLIKKYLKRKNLYHAYKKFFVHRATRFSFTWIISFFNKDLSDEIIKQISEYEFELTKCKDKKQFANIFSKITSFTPKKYSAVCWDEFGIYFYYVWQTSRYYYDKKHSKKNIFISNDYIKLNSLKRNHFYNWVDSLKKCDKNFNTLILYLRKKGI